LRKQALFLSSISPDLIYRLENWADVLRIVPRLNISPTGRFCESLARSKGQIEHGRNPRPDLDEPDAYVVEKCMRRVPKNPRTMIAVHYIFRIFPWRLHSDTRVRLWKLTGLSVRRSEWETELVRAHWMVSNVLAPTKSRVYNSRDNLNAPSALVSLKGVARSEAGHKPAFAYAEAE
jgi:hypothetical protein